MALAWEHLPWEFMLISLLLLFLGLFMTSRRFAGEPEKRDSTSGPGRPKPSPGGPALTRSKDFVGGKAGAAVLSPSPSPTPTGLWPLGHILRAAGWVMFGLFWFSWGPYYLAQDDTVNAIATFGALPVFVFLAYHEARSWQWKDEYAPLRFAGKASVVSGILFYVAYGLASVSTFLIEVVGGQTVAILNWIQPGYSMGRVGLYPGNTELSMPVEWAGIGYIHIVIACTAIQAMFVSVAFIGNVQAPWRRRALTMAIVAVPIYLLNLLRNVTIIYLVYNGLSDFETAHNLIGKLLISLLALFALMFLAFWLLPQLYEVINGMFDLPWRKTRGHDYKANIGRLVNRVVPPKAGS